ncbi:cupin domain-containing protein [Streptomyces sp. NBC_00249]|uniref:cupin domain-containing protein n=1 Tax=Streptomyces sp. NBC_00249 TaxID=2975690 RepID=UPI002259F6C8|nr:cupin domain-containing protein [Streptomyces sp. NBC_00249]MCX5195702.1 cupin domain-containing protein [Streptomyces sp. NBC_00249]
MTARQVTQFQADAVGVLVPFGPTEVEPDGVTVAEADFARSVFPRVPFKTARFTVPPGGTSSPDQHAVQEIWVVHAGSGTLEVDGERSLVGPGSLVGFASQAVHEIFADQGEELVIYSFWWSAPDE